MLLLANMAMRAAQGGLFGWEKDARYHLWIGKEKTNRRAVVGQFRRRRQLVVCVCVCVCVFVCMNVCWWPFLPPLAVEPGASSREMTAESS